WWIVIGFMLMFFLERVFQFHHHDPPAELAAIAAEPSDFEPSGHAGHHHDHEHPQGAVERHAYQLSWIGAAIGLTLHGLVEGSALAAGVAAEQLSDGVT